WPRGDFLRSRNKSWPLLHELRHLTLLRTANDIAHGNSDRGVVALHFDPVDVDQGAEPLLECALDHELRVGGAPRTVGCEVELPQPAAKGGPVHAFTGTGEEQLLDEVANVRGVVGFCGAAPGIELIRKGDVHCGNGFTWPSHASESSRC